ncbi:sigma-70 family RNA polymerase sigma factor [Maliponia aquimaris]|uniref:ECF RNA polymerase sigma factor SigK n=1 Tax=Maliponia aquimaris TaxID=1673631 RepID=A0A238KLC7_9RHOB|nr:sigma-70 family RNA polymerase sigma factor [Maliponia aquimaris]SMX43564.1 ECF RNA polymerase sigma factor SigK [Maliponia aquimaris]
MTAQEQIETLLGRVASGDRTAFRKLYAATSARLYGISLRILRDESLAEEVLEEVYVGIWERAGQYRTAQAAPLTWLVTITRDAAIARLSAERAAGKAAGPLEITERLYAPRPGPESLAQLREEARVLETCLRELPPGRADMLRQAYLYGATYADLADNAGVTQGSLRAALRADLIHLRDCLSR